MCCMLFSLGLFHRAIGMSGTALGWAVRENGPKYGWRFAAALSCSKENVSLTNYCLKAASTDDILERQVKMKAENHVSFMI